MKAPEMNKRVKSSDYDLAYFNLWWARMAIEGRKEAKEMRKVEEEEKLLRRKMKWKATTSKVIEKRKVKDTKSETDILEFPDRVAVSKFMKLEVGGLQTEREKSGKGGMMEGMGWPDSNAIYERSLNSETTKSVFKYGTSGGE